MTTPTSPTQSQPHYAQQPLPILGDAELAALQHTTPVADRDGEEPVAPGETIDALRDYAN